MMSKAEVVDLIEICQTSPFETLRPSWPSPDSDWGNRDRSALVESVNVTTCSCPKFRAVSGTTTVPYESFDASRTRFRYTRQAVTLVSATAGLDSTTCNVGDTECPKLYANRVILTSLVMLIKWVSSTYDQQKDHFLQIVLLSSLKHRSRKMRESLSATRIPPISLLAHPMCGEDFVRDCT